MRRVTSPTTSPSPVRTRRCGQSLCRACIETLEARRLLSFSPAVTYAAAEPRDIDTGDFNGDGHADLVTANGSAVGVRLNNGDGTFQSTVSYPLGNGQPALAVAVGDLNADGKLDLTATTTTSRISGYSTGYYGGQYPIFTAVGHVKVLLGNGDGTFTLSTETKDLGDGRHFSAVLGDLDKDGDLDAALSNWDGSEILVLPGDGDGTFGEPQRLAVGPTPQQINVADLNGDTHLDLITTSLHDSVKVLLGNGNGTFQAAQTVAPGGSHAQGQAVGDVNGDGTLDLIVTSYEIVGGCYYGCYYSYTDVRVNVLIGNGDATFTTGNGYLVGDAPLVPVQLGDFDGDGTPDIAAASYNSGNVNLLRGNGDGTFAAMDVLSIGAPSGGPIDIVVADFDGDAESDIATANYGYNTLSVFLNGYIPPPPLPAVSVSDATVTEGNSDTLNAVFTVTLAGAAEDTVTVQFDTASGSAVAGSDFDALAGTLTFAPGETGKQIVVAVRGDLIDEYDETFAVGLVGATNAQIEDGQGVGSIIDNDPPPTISISNVSKNEGRRGSTGFDFIVSLSSASEKDVSINFATANGTATTSDYVARSGTVFFAAGQTSRLLTIKVIGDGSREANETFFVNLSGATDVLIGDGQGVGTILDDDRRGNKK